MKVQQIGYVVLWGLALIIVLSGARHLVGKTILIDDFSDGNDDRWTHSDTTGDEPYGPATYDASSGVYHLQGAGPVPVSEIGSIGSLWDGSVAPQFSNGLLRAKVSVETEGTAAGFGLRWDEASQLGNVYMFGVSTATDYFFILKQYDAGDNVMLSTLDDPQIAAGGEWILEAGAVGDQLTLKVWRPNDPEPVAPQLAVTDAEFASGGFLVGAYISGNYPEEAIVSATFDDIYFTLVPEPSTLALAALGLLGLLVHSSIRMRMAG